MPSEREQGTTRRAWIGGAVATIAASGAPRPAGTLVDTHIHLFAGDDARFPYAKNAPYKPPAETVESYVKFVREAKIDHAIIVHPEPYQDDHRYLEYCFANEPSPGFFKGTCLFDPVAPDTPSRMEAIVKQHPQRIVALRVHETHERGTPSLRSGPIKDRDLRDPAMRTTWRKAQALGLAIQMHFVPYHAPGIGQLAAEFRDLPVILDHLGRAGQGTPEEFAGVLQLAKYPRVYMKYSGVNYLSKQEYPYASAKPLIRRVYDAFGPDRLIWGGLGYNMADFDRQAKLLDLMFDFAPESERARIRGANAVRLFRF